jgi:hypothetical protein
VLQTTYAKYAVGAYATSTPGLLSLIPGIPSLNNFLLDYFFTCVLLFLTNRDYLFHKCACMNSVYTSVISCDPLDDIYVCCCYCFLALYVCWSETWFDQIYLSRALWKGGLRHVRKVSSQISLCSLHRQIRDHTFHLNWIFPKKRLSLTGKYHKSEKCRPWLACAKYTGLSETTLYAHVLNPFLTDILKYKSSSLHGRISRPLIPRAILFWDALINKPMQLPRWRSGPDVLKFHG